MRFMVIVKASPESEAGKLPTAEQFAAMGKFKEELVNAGVLLAGEGLHPTSRGVRVHFSGDQRQLVHGPFAATQELIAGYWLIDVPSRDEAIAWFMRCPKPMDSDSDIEIRQVYEAADFGDALTPELRAQEDALRERAAAQHGQHG